MNISTLRVVICFVANLIAEPMRLVSGTILKGVEHVAAATILESS